MKVKVRKGSFYGLKGCDTGRISFFMLLVTEKVNNEICLRGKYFVKTACF
jgi:hypothetical protein